VLTVADKYLTASTAVDWALGRGQALIVPHEHEVPLLGCHFKIAQGAIFLA